MIEFELLDYKEPLKQNEKLDYNVERFVLEFDNENEIWTVDLLEDKMRIVYK